MPSNTAFSSQRSLAELVAELIARLFPLRMLQVMMRLFNAEIAYFPCFFLPPPPLREGEIALRDTSTATVPSKEVRDTNAFVMWGLTFGVVSNLVVAAGGCAFAYPAPPHFR